MAKSKNSSISAHPGQLDIFSDAPSEVYISPDKENKVAPSPADSEILLIFSETGDIAHDIPLASETIHQELSSEIIQTLSDDEYLSQALSTFEHHSTSRQIQELIALSKDFFYKEGTIMQHENGIFFLLLPDAQHINNLLINYETNRIYYQGVHIPLAHITAD